MSIKFTKRVAAEILGRGENTIRIKSSSLEDSGKALTRDDVRKLVSSGGVYALPAKHNLSLNGKNLRIRRSQGRSRGAGRRHGTRKTRMGRLWEKKIRAQRVLLFILKQMRKLDNKSFRRYYLLAKGNTFADKRSLLLRLGDDGIKITEDEMKQINEQIKKMHE